jgi:hypothetical protein
MGIFSLNRLECTAPFSCPRREPIRGGSLRPPWPQTVQEKGAVLSRLLIAVIIGNSSCCKVGKILRDISGVGVGVSVARPCEAWMPSSSPHGWVHGESRNRNTYTYDTKSSAPETLKTFSPVRLSPHPALHEHTAESAYPARIYTSHRH